ncbi:hypothetical protein AB1Y20_009081 [Prymnesium parvum]|uniref:HTH myb-type domain-containing protein n=1 Tax=Prymnesium parvum TaxID=97485 RepID=A0AB34K4M5_PRYPA
MGEAARGLRSNYSCGSLAAAEQLEALMRHATSDPSAAGPVASEQDVGLLGALQNQMCGGSMGHNGMLPPHSMDLGDSCAPMHVPFNGGGDVSSCFSQAIDRLDLAGPTALRLGNLPFGSETGCMCSALGDAYAGGHHMDSSFGGASCAASNQFSNACPLSMLHYAGASALGPGAAAMSQQSDANGDPHHQKRRFVWTTDLHSRFEAAVNALGLDNAKPKSILRLMNVDGLTKANIKSHLQKYRCLMQKKAVAAGTTGVGSSANSSDGGETKHIALRDEIDTYPTTECAPSGGAEHLDACAGGLSTETLRGASVPEQQIVSQGGCSLQRNLEVQEMTLKVQMELQEELSRQLQLQKRLQAEMEGMMSAQREELADSSATSSKMSSILALKHKLQTELQAHLKMQHQLLSQLNQVVLPAVGDGDEMSEATVDAKSEGAKGAPAMKREVLPADDDDDDDDDEAVLPMRSSKRRKA